MRKGSNRKIGLGTMVRIVMGESGRTIYSKHRLNTKSMKSKLQPHNFEIFLSRWLREDAGGNRENWWRKVDTGDEIGVEIFYA